MTPSDARDILEARRRWLDGKGRPPRYRPSRARRICPPPWLDPLAVAGAERAAVPLLPGKKGRETVSERIAFIRERLLDELGFDPFASRDRHNGTVIWRQCVFRLLRLEGYRSVEIGRISGYSHSTVLWAEETVKGLLRSSDKLVTDAWNRLRMMV